MWSAEWGGDIIFSHGTSSSKGVSIMFKNNLRKQIHSTIVDPNGRYVILDITINEKRLTLGNIYGPNEDEPSFFMEIIEHIENIPNDNRIMRRF